MPKVYSAALVGLSAEVVEIEVDVSSGLPTTVIVGLPDAAVQEARERVRSAVRNAGADYPRSRVAINLAPADLPKNGSHFDLPIALSILLNSRQIEFDAEQYLVMGELSLDGGVRPVVGLLPALLTAKRKGFKKIIIPVANGLEAALVDGIEIIAVGTLADTVDYLQNQKSIAPLAMVDWPTMLHNKEVGLDFKLISGQESAKRAMEIAAAGGHNILLYGPPGTGKTLLAKALPSILPAMTVEEVLEVTKIYSVCGLLTSDQSVINFRPFRSPHHSSSSVSLVGGGSVPRPGEISLAHRGVLFLDELPEFPRSVLENLRQPLEDGVVTVTRAGGSATFPAQFILIAAQNPCPCGFADHPTKKCICSMMQIQNYQRKVSGPLLDRIDMYIEVSRIEYDKLVTKQEGVESSAQVRQRVERARVAQYSRFAHTALMTNSEMGIKEIRIFCELNSDQREFMKKASSKMNLSARAYHRVLKLARTIADLEGLSKIQTAHLAEALQYRTRAEQ
jgi:magnesium chelatase family protein